MTGFHISQKKNFGYVLLMVLVLMTVIATALTTIATRSLQTTQEAVMAVEQFQQRVGLASCQKTFLPRADGIFKSLEEINKNTKKGTKPLRQPMVGESIVLSGQRFDLVLSDENAKVNLNRMYHLVGLEKVNQELQKKLSIDEFQALRLRPAVPSQSANQAREKVAGQSKKPIDKSNVSDPAASTTETEELVQPAFRSWGEVFDFARLSSQRPDERVQLEFTKLFTLWGAGQVNIERASDESVRTIVELILPPARANVIVTKLRENEVMGIQSVLEFEAGTYEEKKGLSSLLGKYSFAYSLFVDATSPQCRSRKLFVEAVDSSGVLQMSEFVFH